jgi:hypothetical protein
LLSIGDVKEFLTFLAAKQQVASSTQNQAFNALLFFSDMSWERNSGRLTVSSEQSEHPLFLLFPEFPGLL